MHIDYLSNGLGGQSVMQILLAGEGVIPATHVVSANTGNEEDHLTNKGERVSAEDYYLSVVAPLCKKFGLEAAFIKARRKDGSEYESLWSHTGGMIEAGRPGITQPLYNDRGGQLPQTCTQRFKITAIRQQLRRWGAKTACGAQGIHAAEAWRRVKGVNILPHPLRPEWGTYQAIESYRKSPTIVVSPDVLKLLPLKTQQEQLRSQGFVKVPVWARWHRHYYPLVELGLSRDNIRRDLEKRGVPYLVSTECDDCPHKDAARWLRTSPHVIDRIEAREGRMLQIYGKPFFYSNLAMPIREALSEYERRAAADPAYLKDQVDFGCGNAVCGV